MLAFSEYIISGDKPLIDPKNDQLGYAQFAKHLAESIDKMVPTEGLVIAIYGQWGSGKTTMLNFVVHFLNQKSESERPIIVRFNPWWFSGQEDLTRRFFDQFQAVLSKKNVIGGHLKKIIAEFAEVLSNTPSNYAPIGKIVTKLMNKENKDVAELKDSIVNALKNQQRRILVIIDDIDRLTANEIRQLFRTIKAIADFPNVIYLLAFDKEVVIQVVKKIQEVSGETYLEKIIQVSFELPIPDKISLRRLFFERLNKILADTPEELFDPTHWGNVYLDGVDHFIATPRDVIRLTNTLGVTYPAVKGEVNPVDFIAIETLRIYCPLAYDIIRKNPHAFIGRVEHFSDSSKDDLKSFHDSWLAQVQEKDREPVRQLLMRIFPKLEAVWGNTYYDAAWESKWRKQLRVCSPDIFPIYFRLAIPEGGISNAEMKMMLALASDTKAFAAKLKKLTNQKLPDGTTRVRTFLERLEDYTEKDIPIDHIPTIVQVLFDVGDDILRSEDETHGLFDFGIDIRIVRILWQLLKRLDEPARYEVLKKAIQEGDAVSTIVHVVAVLGQQHGKYGAKEPKSKEKVLITAQHLEDLEKLSLEKVRNAASQDFLLQAPKLPYILYRWRDWADEKEVKQWIQIIIKNDVGLARLLEKFLQKTYSWSLSDRVEKREYRLDPKWLEPFVKSSQIIERVMSLIENPELTENQRLAIRQFIREYEMRQQGKNPDFF